MKRTDLARRTQLRARTHSPEKRAWARLRQHVYKRDEGRCVVCGVGLTVGRWECHHRKYRSRGGKNVAANCIAVCFSDHLDRIHGNPADAEANGWAVPSHADPAEIPVLYFDGTFRSLAPKDVAA